MNDIEILQNMYKELHEASIEKNAEKIKLLLAPKYVLIHMTGMRQTGEEYISSVLDGTLNYYNSVHDSIDVKLIGDEDALIDGKSRVNAAVFGGGRNTWRLRQKLKAKKLNGEWKFMESRASTY